MVTCYAGSVPEDDDDAGYGDSDALYKYKKHQGSSFHFLGNQRRVDIIHNTLSVGCPFLSSTHTNGLQQQEAKKEHKMSRSRCTLAWLLLTAAALLSCNEGVHAALRLRTARPTSTTSTTPSSIATTSSSDSVSSDVAELPVDAVTAETQSQATETESETQSESLAKPETSLGKHKRGILHGLHGGGAIAPAGHWPARTYAAQYGYSLQLPAAHTFLAAAPSHHHRHHAFVKYPGAYHVKQYAPAATLGAALLPAAGLAGAVPALPALPTLPALSGVPTVQALPTVPAVQALSPALPALPAAPAVAAAPSYVLRPGNALVSSYSVNYPHQSLHRPIKPVHFHHAVQVSQGGSPSVGLS